MWEWVLLASDGVRRGSIKRQNICRVIKGLEHHSLWNQTLSEQVPNPWITPKVFLSIHYCLALWLGRVMRQGSMQGNICCSKLCSFWNSIRKSFSSESRDGRKGFSSSWTKDGVTLVDYRLFHHIRPWLQWKPGSVSLLWYLHSHLSDYVWNLVRKYHSAHFQLCRIIS